MNANATVTWIDATAELPDHEMTVLVALADGEVWTGFHEAGEWRYVSADNIETPVTHWAEFPLPPQHPAAPKKDVQ